MENLILISILFLTACSASVSGTPTAIDSQNPTGGEGGPSPQATSTPAPKPMPFYTGELKNCKAVDSLTFSNDLKSVYEVRQTGWTTDANEWNIFDGTPGVRYIGHSTGGSTISLYEVGPSVDGKLLIGRSAYNEIFIWDAFGGEKLTNINWYTTERFIEIFSLSWSADSNHLALSYKLNTAFKTEVFDFDLMKRTFGDNSGLAVLGLNPNGTVLFGGSTGYSGTNIITGEKITSKILSDYTARVFPSPDGKSMWMAKGKTITVFDPVRMEIQKTIGLAQAFNLTGILNTPSVSPDGRYIQLSNRTIADTATGKSVFVVPLTGNENAMSLRFSSDGRFLMSGLSTGVVRVYSVGDWRLLHNMCAGADVPKLPKAQPVTPKDTNSLSKFLGQYVVKKTVCSVCAVIGSVELTSDSESYFLETRADDNALRLKKRLTTFSKANKEATVTENEGAVVWKYLEKNSQGKTTYHRSFTFTKEANGEVKLADLEYDDQNYYRQTYYYLKLKTK